MNINRLYKKRKREARAIEMGNRLAKAKIEGVYEGAKALSGRRGNHTCSLCSLLWLSTGIVPTFQKVFDKYLSRGNTGYVPHNWVDIEEAIVAIHEAGGQAILAHPNHYDLSNKWMRRLFTEFKDAGGDAMEVAMGQQSPQIRLQLAMWSEEYGLLGITRQ